RPLELAEGLLRAVAQRGEEAGPGRVDRGWVAPEPRVQLGYEAGILDVQEGGSVDVNRHVAAVGPNGPRPLVDAAEAVPRPVNPLPVGRDAAPPEPAAPRTTRPYVVRSAGRSTLGPAPRHVRRSQVT